MRHRVDQADIYLQYTRSESWSLDEGIVKAGSFSIDQGFGIRAVEGDKTAFAYADDLTWDSLQNAADTVKTIASAGQERSVKIKTQTNQRNLYPAIDPAHGMDSQDKVALLQYADRTARQRDPRVKQVMASLATEYDVILLLREDGCYAADVRPLVRINISVIVEQGQRRETGSSGGGGRFALTEFTHANVDEHVKSAVDDALLNLEARPAPAGEMIVVLGNGWPGILLHEAIGHGLEGDFNRKGASAFSNMMGKQVAARGVTVLDDGTLERRRGSLSVDDEGNPTQRNVLIEDGMLCGYMQDAMNARLMNASPTGNGRRESFAHLPLPRMTNTYMLAGQQSAEEILRSVKNGIYAVNFGGGQVDITSGKFVFSASLAWKIEDGQLRYPVKGATLIGNGPDVLKRVSMIGNDLKLDPGIGTCGKEGQSVPVGVGQPTLRLDGITVGGTA